jgi:hypothetical protein
MVAVKLHPLQIFFFIPNKKIGINKIILDFFYSSNHEFIRTISTIVDGPAVQKTAPSIVQDATVV